MKKKILMSWSGGKDSSYALHQISTSGRYEVVALLTTVTENYDRISMHGVRRSLLEDQAEALGISLLKVGIPPQSSNETYEAAMKKALLGYRAEGVSEVAFGDIFLEDLRRYRENNLQKVSMTGLFPIWKQDTSVMARDFIDRGFKAIVVCVDGETLDGAFSGRPYDGDFLADLPDTVDPCGENGEFHTFVYDGPIFKYAVKHRIGQTVLRDERFYYTDLIPTIAATAAKG